MSTSSLSCWGLVDPRLRKELTRTVGRRVDAADVEDVVQATLAEAFAANALPNADEEIRRFVFAIARQKVADWYRRRGRESRRIFPEVDPEQPIASSADLLRWAVGSLPPRADAERTFEWMLREGEGETLAEIAAVDRVPAPVVRQRVSRLRRYLRARWAKEIAGLALLTIVAVGLACAVVRGQTVANPAPPPSEDRDIAPDRLPAPASTEASSAQGTEGAPASPSQAPPAPSALPAAPTPSAPRTPPVTPPPPSPSSASVGVPFDRAAAAAALGAVDVQSCATASTPSSSNHVVVVFSLDGSVASAVIDAGPIRGQAEAACVEPRFARIHIPAFAGAPVTVGKSFVLAPALTPSPPSTTATPSSFDAVAADTALRAVDLRRCFAEDTIKANGVAVVTFTPNGRSAVANVQWPGSAVAAEAKCMSGLLGMVKVPTFSGRNVTMRGSFVIDGTRISWSRGFVPDVPPPPPARPTATASTSSTSCDPPYDIDPATGRKKYKFACLGGF